MGLPRNEIKARASFGTGIPIDYYHPSTQEKLHGILHKVNARHYEIKDQKTGEIHKFRYWNRIGYERATKPMTETLSPNASASEYIHDFVHSKNSKFDGKSKKKRMQMALAAFYSNKRK